MNQIADPSHTREGPACAVWFSSATLVAWSSPVTTAAFGDGEELGRKSLQRKEPRHGRPKCVPLMLWLFLRSSVARSAVAGPITFTGNVANDFSTSNPVWRQHSNYELRHRCSIQPDRPGRGSFIPANGSVSGWAIKQVALDYNAATDTMYVGVRLGVSPATVCDLGDANGNGNPGEPRADDRRGRLRLPEHGRRQGNRAGIRRR